MLLNLNNILIYLKNIYIPVKAKLNFQQPLLQSSVLIIEYYFLIRKK